MRPEEMTAEQMERARACETAEQMRAFVLEEGIELTEDQLDGVAGGTGFVQGFKEILGPYLYPPCPEGGRHEFEDYDGVDALTQAHSSVRCVKCGAIY